MFKNIFRISEWGNTHLIVIISCYYLFSESNTLNWSDFLSQFCFLLFITLSLGSFGYYLNDVYDVKQDQLAGKNNFAAKHSILVRFLLLTALFSLTIIIWFLLNNTRSVLILLLFETLLLICYSVPFIRLKEKKIMNVITDALYAFVIPGFVILLITSQNNKIIDFHAFCYIFWLFAFGIRSILSHHIEDWTNDEISKTKTSVFYFGYSKVKTYAKIILPSFEFVLFCTFLGLTNLFFLAFYSMFIIYIFFRDSLYKRYKSSGIIKPILNISNLIFNEFYVKWLPLLAILALMEFSWKYLIVYFLHLIIFFKTTISFKYDLKFLYNNIFLLLYYKTKAVTSLILNYSLYYLFLLVGINLKKRAERKILKNENKNLNIENPLQDSVSVIHEIIHFPTTQLIAKEVHSLYLHTKLNNVELLTIKSFLDNGYIFHLWVSWEIENPFPNQLIIKNVNEILPKTEIVNSFYPNLFKYSLLFKKGGWWVDLDITCLQYFDTVQEYYFSSGTNESEIGSLMKVPKGSQLMKNSLEDEYIRLNKNDASLSFPISTLSNNIFRLNLEKFISSDHVETDKKSIEDYYFNSNSRNNDAYFIKWEKICEVQMLGIKNAYYNSFYSLLLRKYQLMSNQTLPQQKLHDNKVRTNILLFNLKNIM